MDLPDKILYYLAKNNLNQQDLARQLGINRSYISRIINNQQTPSKKLKLRIELIIGE